MHGFDALTPVDETLRALDDLVTSGKIAYVGASNFSGWQLMASHETPIYPYWHQMQFDQRNPKPTPW